MPKGSWDELMKGRREHAHELSYTVDGHAHRWGGRYVKLNYSN